MFLLALVVLLALFPPGPTAPARAQGDPPPAPSGRQVFLPLAAGGGAAPDLACMPDAVSLAPGHPASVQVRVEPQADLRGASFELPGVQDGVSASFEAAPDGKSGTLRLEASEASEAGERALMVEGTSGDGAKGWVGKLTVTTTSTSRSFFVNPVSGKDTNSGSQGKP